MFRHGESGRSDTAAVRQEAPRPPLYGAEEDIRMHQMSDEGQISELPERTHKTRSSTIRTRKQQAVCVRNAHKFYGSRKEPVIVLDGLNMTVPKGVIYGLLGASGCGKTTLLSCIVGRRRLTSGEIWVLGGTPGSKSSGVPGPRIGYMPQDTALYSEFSIRETLVYFGWIAGMPHAKVRERTEFLQRLFMLPSMDRRVKDLSGGQRRRVSLAAALLHEPELLILDEPTVGLDPVLREGIWNHFLDITREGRTTVIITTHYIDETRQAHLIALMRGGYLLAEESPDDLLARYGLDALEDVFLRLSVKQNSLEFEKDYQAKASSGSKRSFENKSFVGDDGKPVKASESPPELAGAPGSKMARLTKGLKPSLLFFRMNHMRALLWKNFLWILRNIPILLCMLLLPFVQSVLFCVCIGKDPVDLTMAVVNLETNNVIRCDSEVTCNNTRLSCGYLHYLEKRGVVLIPYDTEVAARESVSTGETYASMVLRQNYSDALRSRVADWENAMDWDVESSEIDVFRDISNKLIANYLKVLLYDTFQSFLHDYLTSCDMGSRWVMVPVKWEIPVYGDDNPTFTDFVAPGLIVTFTSFLAVGLTAITMLMEKSEGILERSLVIGISGVELLISHTVCQFVIMFLQAVITLVTLFALFNVAVKGSLALVVFITLLTGFCGMCYGLLISCMCSTIVTAFFIAMGSFLPMVILGGILWPVEGMHSMLQSIVFIFPLTKITESLRSVMQRGWDVTSDAVYMGIFSVSIWILLFLTLSILFVKFKKE